VTGGPLRVVLPMVARLWLKHAAVFVALGGEGGEQFGDVLAAARLHGDVDGGVAEIDAVVGPIVEGVDDVGAVAGDDAGKVLQGAG
jgi:hypothetical protein